MKVLSKVIALAILVLLPILGHAELPKVTRSEVADIVAKYEIPENSQLKINDEDPTRLELIFHSTPSWSYNPELHAKSIAAGIIWGLVKKGHDAQKEMLNIRELYTLLPPVTA